MKEQENKSEQVESNKNSDKNRSGWGGNVVAAFILIFVGILFLANNLGIVPWYIWADVWRFWPVVLILLGLQFLLGKSLIARIILGIITVMVFIAIILYVLIYSGLIQGSIVEKWLPGVRILSEIEETTQSELSITENEYTDITSRDIIVDAGIGNYILHDSKENEYFSIEFDTRGTFDDPEIRSENINGNLRIWVNTPGSQGFTPMPHMGNRLRSVSNIGQPEIPTTIDVSIGAGSGEIRLDELELQKLSVDVGMGSAVVNLKDTSVPKEIDLNVGVGSMKVTVPAQTALNIKYEVGMGNFRINGQNFQGNGEYNTDDSTMNRERILVTVNVGTGTVEIIQAR